MHKQVANRVGLWLLRSSWWAGMALWLGGAAPVSEFVSARSQVAAGEYLVAIGGCNDCHTTGWNRAPGKVPPAQRLTGSPIGWHGPWGTSYAVNLRLLVQQMTPEGWVQYVAVMKPRPPMPAFNMQSMSEQDLRAIYAYIHSLGPAGDPTPNPLPPGEEPATQYIEGVPQQPHKG